MQLIKENDTNSESLAAQRRLLSVPGDPFLFADWERVLFLHFAIAPEMLRPFVRPPLELDLFEGQAYLSVVAVTMRRFRPTLPLSLGWALAPISIQKFLNVRTYVCHRDEPGALFLWGWLSKPAPLPPPTFNLPCGFAKMTYRHETGLGQLHGQVAADSGRFTYNGKIPPRNIFQPCPFGSLSEFAMERYTGFFSHGNRTKIFRTWHPQWLQKQIDITMTENSLLTAKFDFFKEANFVGANFAPGFKQVSLGRAHPLGRVHNSRRRSHGPSTLFEMP